VHVILLGICSSITYGKLIQCHALQEVSNAERKIHIVTNARQRPPGQGNTQLSRLYFNIFVERRNNKIIYTPHRYT